MKKVCIIIPYFGSWPPYLNLFLKSCSYNPELTVLFFTDLKAPDSFSDNVKFYYCTLANIKSRLDQILGFESANLTPYKLCDVRPIYGLIFKDYIKDFDFWGWGDIDILYGRIRDFGIEELLCAYDVISFKNKWVSGSFCMIKNNDINNRLYSTARDLQKVFTNPKHMCFDEISFCWEEARHIPIDRIDFPSDNFTRIVWDAVRQGRIKAYFSDHLKESISRHGYLIWEEGRITDHNGNMFLLYHYITEKKKPYFKYPEWDTTPGKFFIDRKGFYHEGEFKKRRLIGLERILKSTPTILINFVREMRDFVNARLS